LTLSAQKLVMLSQREALRRSTHTTVIASFDTALRAYSG